MVAIGLLCDSVGQWWLLHSLSSQSQVSINSYIIKCVYIALGGLEAPLLHSLATCIATTYTGTSDKGHSE